MKYLLLPAILAPLFISAQTRFSRLYDYQNQYQSALTVLEMQSGGYLVGSKNIGAEYSDNKLLLHRLDAFGDEVWQKEIYAEGFIYYLDFGAMLRLPDGNYLLGGDIKEISTELHDAFIIKIDTSGNVLWEKTYGAGDKNDFFGNFALTPDSSHIQICGQTRKTDAAGNIWFVKTDLNGDQIWQKELGEPGWQHAYCLAMLNDGSFLLAVQYGSSDAYQYRAYKISSSGQIIWQKKVGSNYNDNGFPKIIALSDGSGIFTGSLGTSDWRVHLAYAVKLSPAGEIVWEKTYHTGFSSYAFVQPIVLEDGSVVLSGGVDYDTLSSPLYVRFWKIDSEGDMIWEQIYHYNPDSSNVDGYCYHQIGTSDNGFIGVGSSSVSNTFQDIWVLKLDSEGCLVENCTVSAEEPEGEGEKEGDLVFVPNPASEVTAVRYTLEIIGREAAFFLTDIYGRQVLKHRLADNLPPSEFILYLNALPNGTYIGSITVDGREQAISRLVIVK
ncbi:MAG: hypothetical protein DYG98_23225 [Haliscomenobacteraceae bacterium CHB4]|nr:hypothetical protein [Saprospiraceae bacterium]MCE7925972.1 hypothetical protein [Haliscomenobacteraceae bacterium CHB4]